MIYWNGLPIKIVATCGEVKVPGFTINLTLLKCETVRGEWEEPAILWRFREYLRADNGWIEISEQAAAAPGLVLPDEDIKRAITEARTS